MTAAPRHLPPSPPGPWFRAVCALDCSACDATIFGGQQARADMDGGFLCRVCGQRGAGTEEILLREGLL